MTDRELLEAAAEAAGVDFIISGGQLWTTMDGSIHKHTERWNPLANDGQALRLAVKLMIDVEWIDRHQVLATNPPADGAVAVSTRNDPYAATRRAIVRAAAALTRMESKE